MLSIDETIGNVEKLYQAVTGRPVPPTDAVYAPIPAERDPLEHVEEQLSRLLSAVGQTVQGAEPAQAAASFTPPLAVLENEREVVFTLEIPGVKREDVEVVVQGNVLTVRGEKRAVREDLKVRMSEAPAGSFRRVVALPPGVKSSEPNAQLRDGVLEIRLPRETREAAAPKPVPVS